MTSCVLHGFVGSLPLSAKLSPGIGFDRITESRVMFGGKGTWWLGKWEGGMISTGKFPEQVTGGVVGCSARYFGFVREFCRLPSSALYKDGKVGSCLHKERSFLISPETATS
jgi:hypothetical protein